MWQSCCDYETGKQESAQQCQHIRGARLPSSSLIYLPALRTGLINLKTPLPTAQNVNSHNHKHHPEIILLTFLSHNLICFL